MRPITQDMTTMVNVLYFLAASTSYFLMVVNSLYCKMDHRTVAPRSDRQPPLVFIIDPTPPPENDLPPPYPTVSHQETPVEPYKSTSSPVATSGI